MSPRLRTALAALGLACTLTSLGAPALAAQISATSPVPADFSDPADWDSPSNLDNNWFNVVQCINWVVVGSAGFVAEPVILPSCLQDTKAEDATREQVKAENRWLRGSLLTLATVWQTVHAVQQIVQMGRETITAFESLTHGLGDRVPSATLFRIASATDNVNQSLSDVQTMQVAIPFQDGRLQALNALAVKALATSRDGQEAAVSLGDQAAGLQVRLASGSDIQIVGIGDADGTGTTRGPGVYTPPVPTEVQGLSGETLTDPVAVNAAVNSSDEGPTTGPSAGPSAAGAPGLASPPAAAGTPTRAGTTAGAGTPTDPTVCAVPDDMKDNATSFQQIVVMSQNAQAAAAKPGSDVSTLRSTISATRTADEGFEAEREYLHLLWQAGSF